jgi:hypothetical protein
VRVKNGVVVEIGGSTSQDKLEGVPTIEGLYDLVQDAIDRDAISNYGR